MSAQDFCDVGYLERVSNIVLLRSQRLKATPIQILLITSESVEATIVPVAADRPTPSPRVCDLDFTIWIPDPIDTPRVIKLSHNQQKLDIMFFREPDVAVTVVFSSQDPAFFPVNRTAECYIKGMENLRGNLAFVCSSRNTPQVALSMTDCQKDEVLSYLGQHGLPDLLM